MKYVLMGIGVVALFSVLLLSPALAQEEESLPDPGLTPDHPLYFLDDFWKSIRLSLTRKAEAQVELRLKFAQEKLAEMRAMAEEKKEGALGRATARYEEHLAEINERLEKANLTDEQRTRIEDRLTAAAEKHQAQLDRIEERTEKRLRHLLDRARDKSHEQRINVLEMLREHRPERAAEIAADALEKRAEHIHDLLESGGLSDEERARLEEQLAHLEELSALGENAVERLEGETHERVGASFEQARAQAEARLQEIIERAPEQALRGLQNALERIRKIENPRELRQIKIELEDRRQNRREQHGEVRDRGICIQVITPARNSQTGEVKNFPTPCDVPEGWEKISARTEGKLREKFDDLRDRSFDRIREIRENIAPDLEKKREGQFETPGFFLFNLFPFLED